DPATLDGALAKARERIRQNVGDMSTEAKKAMAFIQSQKQSGALNARLLVSLYREAKQLHFLYGLAEVTGVDNDTVADLLKRRDVDGLAMIGRVGGPAKARECRWSRHDLPRRQCGAPAVRHARGAGMRWR